MIYLYCTITWQAVPFQRLEFELFFSPAPLDSCSLRFVYFSGLFFSNSAERVSNDALVVHFYLGVVCKPVVASARCR